MGGDLRRLLHSADERKADRLRRAMRRIAMVAGGTAGLVVAASLLAPIDRGAIGATFCYPVVGPVQRFAPDLADSMLQRVRVHEGVHADQCRRDGAVWHMIGRLLTRRRLQSEAEADCAEVRFGIARGGQARLLYASALDELRDAPWFHRVKTSAMDAALASQCPDVAARAAREEAEWQIRIRHEKTP